jgi:LBP / BPI / CETP family, N-terminal domain.
MFLLGSDKGGHPTISVLQCHSHVGKISLMFKGGFSFFYNLLSSVIEREMESTLKELVTILLFGP